MSSSEDFVTGMRRRARRAYLRSSIIQVLLAAGLFVYGFFFPSVCGDCAEHPILGWLLAGAMIAGGAAWIAGVARGVVKRRTPAGDPLNAELSPYGDPAVVAAEIAQAFAGQSFRGKQLFASGRWLCYAHKTQVTVRRADALVWAYVEHVRHRLNFIIPIGTTTQVVIWTRDGQAAVLPMKQKAAEAALVTLQAAAPRIFVGYSDARKESWNNDRADFIALVDREGPAPGPRP